MVSSRWLLRDNLNRTIMKEEISNLIALGDIHGLTVWKEIVAVHPDALIVFLGDYLDPYDACEPAIALDNLRDIIAFKEAHPERVVLLLGNHDLHYFSKEMPHSVRYSHVLAPDAEALFTEKRSLFQYAFQVGKLVFTHAGISNEWFLEDFGGDPSQSIAFQLNHPAEEQMAALFRVGTVRGGADNCRGGIFWADRKELHDPLHGYTQVVGHTRVRYLFLQEGKNDNRVIFCDCLRYGSYFKLKD